MTTPSDNYYWRSISRQDKVVDCGTHWEVYSWLGRNLGVVYWEGREAAEAQKFLRDRAVQTQKTVDPNA